MRWTTVLLSIVIISSSAFADDRVPFASGAHRPVPEHRYDLEHVRMELRFDLDRASVGGTVTNTLTSLHDGLDTVTLHARKLSIRSIRDSAGRDLKWSTSGESELQVALATPLQAGTRESLAITYEAQPETALYFIRPDAKYPSLHPEIWSLGWSEYNRNWIPSWDYPNDLATSEMIATVRSPMRAISNGTLLGVRENSDATRTFHWREDKPHASYLNSIIVGEYSEVTSTWRDVPVSFHVPAGREAEGQLAFGRTPLMMEFFSTLTGVPYPYSKFTQSTVSRFTIGGMEHVSAVTMTANTLHETRNHEDFSSDSLVAHELAHQWLGDLVTNRTWAHMWINEGGATYLQSMWFEHDLGADEFDADRESKRQSTLAEDRRYRRPVVTYVYDAPERVGDSHTYQKGALVFHMLRRVVGDDAFRKGLNLFLTRYRHTPVETEQLRLAMEETSGLNLRPFFQQWLYSAGHPEITITSSWNDEAKTLDLTFEQTQSTEWQTPAVFEIDTNVEIATAGGVSEHPVHLAGRVTKFSIPLREAPLHVVFDPAGDVLAVTTHKRTLRELESQLLRSPRAITRTEAALLLGDSGDTEAVAVLVRQARTETFRGVREAIATALGKYRTREAREALLALLADRSSRVRVAAAKALGDHDARLVAAPLERAFRTDTSDAVRAATITSLGQGGTARASQVIAAALETTSHNETVRSAALRALSATARRGDLATVERFASYGAPEGSRAAAVTALGSWPQSLPTLHQYETDPVPAVRRAVVAALETIGTREALARIDAIVARGASDPYITSTALQAQQRLAAKLGK